jgi:hypothetical protein
MHRALHRSAVVLHAPADVSDLTEYVRKLFSCGHSMTEYCRADLMQSTFFYFALGSEHGRPSRHIWHPHLQTRQI